MSAKVGITHFGIFVKWAEIWVLSFIKKLFFSFLLEFAGNTRLNKGFYCVSFVLTLKVNAFISD